MIFDTLENLSKYEAVLSGVKEAVRVLKETDLKSLEKGSYETQNKDVAFFEASGSLSFTAEPGFFVIFFPGEPHRPGLCAQNPEKIKKVIFKIIAE